MDKSLAIMMPLPVRIDNFNKYILEECWSSIYRQSAISELLIHVYFSAVPKLFDKYAKYLEEKFKLPFTLLKVKRIENQPFNDGYERLRDLAFHRNALLEVGKKHNYGLFLDSDVILPSNAIHNLILDGGEISAGIIPQIKLKSPIKIVHEKILNANDFTAFLAFGFFDKTLSSVTWGDLQTVENADVVATACMMLSRKIMNDDKVKCCLFPLSNGEFLGEDVGYCLSARRSGYRVFVNRDVLCKHMRRIQDRLTAYSYVTEKSKCIVNFLFWSDPL